VRLVNDAMQAETASLEYLSVFEVLGLLPVRLVSHLSVATGLQLLSH
jgi:hypothetical protein